MKLTADKLSEWQDVLSQVAGEHEAIRESAMQGVYGIDPHVADRLRTMRRELQTVYLEAVREEADRAG